MKKRLILYQNLAKRIFVLSAVLLIAACGTTLPDKLNINTSIQAQGHDSRTKIIVLHYTVSNTANALKILSTQNVSSHYLISDDSPPAIYRLVDENRRAWHAGVSQWYNRPDINTSSIGIEIVNSGPSSSGWASYPDRQIDVVIDLVRDIAQRHEVEPQNIVGHSDIAPQRKLDPGPLFPWKKLAQAGLGRWYNEDLAKQKQLEFQVKGLPNIAWVQQQLKRIGYTVPLHGVLDKETQNVISAFQMHYRPQNHNGHPDLQTMAILAVMP